MDDQAKKKGKGKHQEFRDRTIRIIKEEIGVVISGKDIAPAIKTLIDAGEYEVATTFLFGCEKKGGNNVTRNALMHFLCSGQNPELLQDLARNHYWSDRHPGQGEYATEVYPEEFLVFDKSATTRLFKAVKGIGNA